VRHPADGEIIEITRELASKTPSKYEKVTDI